MSCCSHCGKEGVALKCSRCKQASYCGAECQKSAWPVHKKTCEKPLPPNAGVAAGAPLPLSEVFERVKAADLASDWRGLLKYQGRMEELIAAMTDHARIGILQLFVRANLLKIAATGCADAPREVIRLEEMRIDLQGKAELFRDQGKSMCNLAFNLLSGGKNEEAGRFFQKHGFFSVECQACIGLGQLALQEGRTEEAVDLLRNATSAAPLNEEDCEDYELVALQPFVDALFSTGGLDDVELVLPRYREAAKAEAQRKGELGQGEVHCLYATARLLEARGKPAEAADEFHALLSLLNNNGNKASVQGMLTQCQDILREACTTLTILDPRTGAADSELCDAYVLVVRKLCDMASKAEL